MSDRYHLRPYLDLINDFLEGRRSAPDFEHRYLRLFKADTSHRPMKVFEILDRLFADVDFYVADPELREPDKGDLDDAGLRDRAAEAQRRLRRYITPR